METTEISQRIALLEEKARELKAETKSAQLTIRTLRIGNKEINIEIAELRRNLKLLKSNSAVLQNHQEQ